MAGLKEKLQRMWNPPDDEYEYDDYYDDDEQEPERAGSTYDEPRRNTTSSFEEPRRLSSYDSNISSFDRYSRREEGSRVVNINAKTQLQVVLFRPVSFGDEAQAIANELLKRHTVVLNLEKTDKEVARRIVDFLSGVAYANNGKIKRVATGTFIITPYNVDLTGDDVLDELENSGLYF